MVHAKNAGSNCCHCGDECIIFTDDFNRANNTDLGNGWVEPSGDWEILSNELRANGTGLVYTTANLNKARRNVRVTAKNVQPGKVYRLLLAVAADGSDYICIEMDCGDPEAIVSLRMASGAAIDSFELEYVPGNDYTLQGCVSDEGTYGGLAEISRPVWDCTAFDGSRAGIANMGTAAEYDDFIFAKHDLDADDTDLNCEPCPCECDAKCLPRTLTLTLESSCEHRDGLTVTLELNIERYPKFVWDGEATWPNPHVGGGSDLYHFRLFCRAGNLDCGDGPFYLCSPEYMGGCTGDGFITAGFDCETGFPERGRCSDVEICDPLELRFGPADCTFSLEPESTCTETVVITA